MSFFHTTEFYVILFLAAMAIVAFMAMPHSSGPVNEYLIGSDLVKGEPDVPAISIDCDDKGGVWLRRSGLPGIDITGAVSAKIVAKGFNITVFERLTAGIGNDEPAGSALFMLDFLARERYYLRYESESTNSYATLAFRNIPGYHAQAILKQ